MDYPNDQAPGAPVRQGIPEHGRIPKYCAVKARLDRLVGELGEGDPLPTERDLSEEYEVARETVRQAIRAGAGREAAQAGPGHGRRRTQARTAPLPRQLHRGRTAAGRTPGLAALGWQDLVPLTLCPADAGGRGRPYPDMVLTAFLRTAAADDVRQAAVVGDTSYDRLSGVRAGAGVVAGVLTGAHDADTLRAAGASHVLGSVAELPGVLT